MNKFSLIGVAVATLISGCANIEPMKHKEGSAHTEAEAATAAAVDDAWQKAAVVSEGKSSVVLFTPMSLPESVKRRKVSMELEPGMALKDVVAVLGNLGITAVLADEDVAKKTFYLPRFNGTVGDLLSTLSKATDVWFTWHDGTVFVTARETIGVSVPQETGFATELEKGLEKLKIDTRAVQWQAGMASLSITPSQFKSVKKLLERYTANAAVVTMQVAVVNVTLNQTAKQGIDWDNLQVAATRGGNQEMLRGWKNAINSATTNPTPTVATNTVNNGTNGTNGTTGTTGSTGTATSTTTTTAMSALNTMQALAARGTALSGAIFTQNFTFQGLFNYLQTYGVAETKQNVLLKTVAGNKVEFKSLTQIPYVAELGVTTTSGTSSSSSLGSTKTGKADDGITVELTPTYDAAANSVTIDLKLSIKAVVAFNELSAGNQIGKLTQPTTAERSFTDTLRLRPGQTVVVGGLNYDSVSDNRGSPLFLSGTKLESQSLTVNRQSMFIVVRPTVMKLGNVLAEESGDSLDLLPKAKEPIEVKKPESQPKKPVKKGA